MKKALLFIASGIVLASCSKTEIEQAAVTSPVDELDMKIVYYLTGDGEDVETPTEGGTVLMGGSTDVDAAFEWMIDRSGGGDFVVIRVTGEDGYNQYIYDMGGLNSVETIVINTVSSANSMGVYNRIINAEALFIAGGDQWNYVNIWKGTLVEDAINYLINTKHAPVGGTSAGEAIMGDGYFDAMNGTVTSEGALNNPYKDRVSIQYDNFIENPWLKNTICDQHYIGREGRHLTFMARLSTDYGINVKGIGVDEETAACIDEDGHVQVFGINNAYFCRQTNLAPEACVSGHELTWKRAEQAVTVYKVPGTLTGDNTFELSDWATGSGGTWGYFWAFKGEFHSTF